MRISREVKISDRNYGNSTHSLEFDIAAEDLIEMNALLDKWEGLLRSGSVNFGDIDNMTVKEAKVVELVRKEFNNLLIRMSDLAQRKH